MPRHEVTGKDVCYLFKGKYVDDDALYELYCELLDTFHGLGPDSSPEQRREALVEASRIRGEAVRRDLIPGHTFDKDEREGLVSQELARLRRDENTKGAPADTPPVKLPSKPNKGLRTGTTARDKSVRREDNSSSGQLSLFG